jgi:WD40 repeat protein
MGHHLHGAPATFPLGMPVVVGIPRGLANAGTRARWQGPGKRNCRLLSSPRARYCKRHFVESGPGDPNAPTRTAAPGGSDAATDEGGDPDRTRSSADQTQASVVGTPRSGAEKARRPAPLQYRDPERYEVIAEHGRGGLGRVMRARDKELGRPVAIKEMLHPGMTSELRFFREALITARLEHPGIVPVHEAGRWPDGTPFYAMKLVAGRPLKAVIDDATTLEARLALLPHVIAVADAVAYAHSRGIIHRDLKPSNVIVGDFGETVVIDWGLAKDIADPDDPSSTTGPSSAPGLTMAGTVLGTPGYMPPEQAAGVSDARSDIYAIGALLGQLLDGHAPEGSSTSPALPSPRVTRRVPPALRAVVAKATAADPQRRYATARELGDDLRRHQGGALVAAHRYSLTQLIHHWASHNRRLLDVSVVAFLAVLTVLAVSAVRVVREKNRAARAQEMAVAGRESLLLSHARAALRDDPTLALLWLAKYRGAEVIAAQEMGAEAIARGIASFGSDKHSKAVLRVIGAGSDRFLSSARDGALVSWTIQDRELLAAVVHKQMDDAGMFAHHLGSERLAYAGDDGVVRLQEHSGQPRDISRVTSQVHWLEFSPDGDRLLLAQANGKLEMFTAKQGWAPMVLRPTGPPIVAFSWVAGAKAVVSLSINGDADLWALNGGRGDRVHKLTSFLTGDVRKDRVVVVHRDATVSVLDDDLQPLREFQVPDSCGTPRLSNGARLAVFHCRERVVVVEVDSGRVMFDESFSAETSMPTFAPNDEWVGFGDADGRVHVVPTGTWTSRSFIGHVAATTSRVAFVGPWVISGDESGDVRVWPLRIDTKVLPIGGNDLRRIVSSHDGRWIAGDSSEGVIRLWSADGQLVNEFRGHNGVVPSVSFTDDDRYVVTAGWDRTVRLWPVTSGDPRVLAGHSDRVMAARSVLGAIASAGRDGKLITWSDDGTGTVAWQDTDGYMRMDVHGSSVAVAGGTGSVLEWDAVARTSREVMKHERQVDYVKYSADGRFLVTADLGGRVKVLQRTSETVEDVSIPSPITGIVVAPDGRMMAIGSEDGVLSIFSLSTPIRLVSAHEAQVKRMAISADGRYLAAICLDGLVRVWDVVDTSIQAYRIPDDPPMGIAFIGTSPSVAASTSSALILIGSHDSPLPADATHLRRAVADKIRQFGPPRTLPSRDREILFNQPDNRDHP